MFLITKISDSILKSIVCQKLEKSGLMSNDFSKLWYFETMNVIENHITSKDDVTNYLNCLVKSLESPEKMLKAVCFIHSLQQKFTGKSNNSSIFYVLIEKTEIIKDAAQDYHQTNNKEQKKYFEFSKKSERVIANQRENSQNFSQKVYSVKQLSHNHIEKSTIKFQNSKMSKREYLCKNIILPYISYLLKLLNNQSMSSKNQKIIRQKQINFIHIWPIINAFKGVIKISDCFVNFLRYAMEMKQGILFLIRFLDKDLKKLYPLVFQFLSERVCQIQNEVKKFQLKKSDLDENQRLEELQKICKANEIWETKELIRQLSTLNYRILLMYRSKITSFDVSVLMKINPPQLYQTQTVENLSVDFVLQKIEQIQKKRNRRQNKNSNESHSSLSVSLSLMNSCNTRERQKELFSSQKMFKKQSAKNIDDFDDIKI